MIGMSFKWLASMSSLCPREMLSNLVPDRSMLPKAILTALIFVSAVLWNWWADPRLGQNTKLSP